MTPLTDAVRERLTDAVLEEIRSRIVRNVVEDQHGWVVHYTTPQDMRDSIMLPLAPVLEQAQRELDDHVFQQALEQVGNVLGCVGAFTPQDVVDAAKQEHRLAGKAAEYWNRLQSEQAQGAQTPTGEVLEMLRELVTFARSERDEAHARVLACGNDIERSRPYFARVQAFAEVLAWAGEPKRSPFRIDPLPSPPADPGGGS